MFMGIVGAVVANAIAYTPKLEMPQTAAAVLGVGITSALLLIVGLVVLVVWFVRQLY